MDGVNMVKIKIMILLSFILIATLGLNVNAFGVSSPYWDENPLYLNPGETKNVVMVLQNMVGGEDVTAIGELDSGKEIAVLTDQITTYTVLSGVSNVPVNLKITVPEDAKPGQEWQVGVSFKTIAPGGGGVSIGTAVSKGFKVIVKEEPSTSFISTPEFSTQTTGFLVLAAALVILVFIIKRFHKKREDK